MLTRSGVATSVAAAVSFAAGRVFGLPELFIAGAALVAAVLLAVATVARRSTAVTATRSVHPPMVPVGDVVRVDLALHNPSHRRTPRLSAWEAVGDAAGVALKVAPMPPGDRVVTAYRVPTSARGHVTIGPMLLDRTDVLGLCRARTWLPGTLEVVVVPVVVPLRFPDARSRGPLGEDVRTRSWARSGTEFHSQREYVPGDDLRRINWKSSARTGALMVTERAPESIRHCTVVLDPRLPHGAPDELFERLATAAGSVVTAATQAQVSTRFLAPGIDLRGPSVAPDTMRFLAEAGPGNERVDPAVAGRGTADGIGMVVQVTAVGSETGWSGPDDVSLVVDVTGGSGRTVVDGSTAQALAASWERVVHGGVTR